MPQSDSSSVRDNKKMWINAVNTMRERLKNRVDANMFEGIREDKLYHGLKLTSSILLIGTFAEICYCCDTQEYLVLDTGTMVHRYSMQGKPIRPSYPLSSTMLFTRMLWCPKAKVVACFIPQDDIIWILTTSCKLLQIIRNEFRIENVFYSLTSNDIIVVGPNKVTIYPMHDTEHPINSLKTLSYLDNSYGSMWRIENSSLIEQSSSMSLAGSYLTTIYVMSLEPEKDKETGISPAFLAKKSNATKSAITALHYNRTSGWIISGDQQGNILGWNFELECIMSCPSDHDYQIRIITSHPSICGFITCSDDNILQVWSCNLRGKMESFREIGDIGRIALNEAASSLATLGTKLSCFHMHQLYVFYALLTAPAKNLYLITNPMFPTRLIVSSTDNTVRILSAQTGRQIDVQILPPSLEVVDVAYSGIANRMYTIILKTGEILVSNAKTNPMELKHVWVNDEYTISCIVAYEYYEQIRALKDEKKITINPISTRIIAGTVEGSLVIIEESSGRHENVIPAHEGSVINLCVSMSCRKLVSLGIDKCVKVWRVFPDINLPLALYYTIYNTVPITRTCLMGHVLCMVSSTEKTRIHPLFMYNTLKRIRLEHHPSKDHSAFVVNITASESLEICASSSMDDTIRIWDHQNALLKILEINTCAWKISFSTLRGDIVFSASRHLYKIPYENYLAPKYRARLIVNQIPEDLNEDEIPETINYRVYDREVDRQKALHPVSSIPFGSLDIENSQAPRLDLMILNQMCINLRYRDEDILQIKEGVLKGKRRVGDKSVFSCDAWDKHVKELLESSTKPLKDMPRHNFWKNVEKYSKIRKTYNDSATFEIMHGPREQNFSDQPQKIDQSVDFPKLPLSGFLPNSLAYKIHDVEITKRQSIPRPKKKTFKYQYPPEILMGERREDLKNDMDMTLKLAQLVEFGNDKTTVE